jgi:hypothetical protein
MRAVLSAALGGPILALVVLALVLGHSGVSAQAPAQSTGGLTVTVDYTELKGATADVFTINSTITNTGTQPTPPLIANLSLVSAGLNSYVDPEDWSPERAISIDSLAPGASDKHAWSVHAIQDGDYSIFIVVLPDSTASSPTDRVVGSPAIHLHVDLKRSLNPAGVTPVAVAVPLVLGLILVATKVVSSRATSASRKNSTPRAG